MRDCVVRQVGQTVMSLNYNPILKAIFPTFKNFCKTKNVALEIVQILPPPALSFLIPKTKGQI